MHDPMTVAFEIKYPWRGKPSQFSPKGYRGTFITIWHVDPEKDGTDDSCGWFKRSRHGDKEILAKIEREFKFEMFSEHCGMFDAEGKPKFSSIAITLNLFRRAAYIHFKSDWNKVERFITRNLAQLILFAENPVDSLHGSITQRYGKEDPEYRSKDMASVIYGYILRAEQPWYRHARWHIHHWSIQIHPLQQLKRALIDRCSICGKRFGFGRVAMGNWGGNKIWHQECETNKN